MSVFSISGLNS